MVDKEYVEQLKQILMSTSLSDEDKKNELMQYHENDIADMLDDLDDNQRDELHRILGDEVFGDVLLYSEDISEQISSMEPEEAADVIEKMDADDAIDVLEELDEDDRKEIVNLMDPEAKEDIQDILKYDDDEIGSKMTNNYISILVTNSVKTAMKRVVAEAAENDNVSNIYVVDVQDKLVGVIELRDLIIAREGIDLGTIVKQNYPSFHATDKVEDCLAEMREYALPSYPILDDQDRLIGAITHDDVQEAMDEEMGEDYAKLGGLTEEEDLDESPFKSVKKRIPWLAVLLVLDLLISFTMANFENVVAVLAIIAFFQTLVLDMAGNAGTQSLSVTIRMISTNDVTGKKIARTILKEFLTGVLNGVILATISFGFVMLYLFIFKKGVVNGDEYNVVQAISASSIVGIALLVAMTVSSLVGSIIPIIFYKMKIDPAVASGPFITTINDVTALLIYYGLAAFLFFTVLGVA
ncbi:MAG: magnesium transporter [Acholeplasmatales bacterium]|nr:magnesium transporter [Acholeplasmatales bacterium]